MSSVDPRWYELELIGVPTASFVATRMAIMHLLALEAAYSREEYINVSLAADGALDGLRRAGPFRDQILHVFEVTLTELHLLMEHAWELE